jgi:predicted Rossmann-fold nucleotide-binding protein
MEVLTLKQLGQFTAPIIFLNVGGYFNPLLQMLDKAIEEHFMLPQHRMMYVVANQAEEVMAAIEKAPTWEAGAINFIKEKIG